MSAASGAGGAAVPPAVFQPSVLEELLKRRGAKVNGVAARVLSEYLRLFTAEAVHRAAEAAKEGGSTEIDLAHVKTVLAELLLDF